MMLVDDSSFPCDEPIPQQIVTIILVADTSGGSDKADRINTLLREMLPELVAMNQIDPQTQLTVAVLTCAGGCKWLPFMPVAPENFVLKPLQAGGKPCLGMAYQELARRMIRKDLFQYKGSRRVPVLLLISDGDYADDDKAGMEELSQNRWYQFACKIALPLSQDANLEVLGEFTKNIESVLMPSHGTDKLVRMVRPAMQNWGELAPPTSFIMSGEAAEHDATSEADSDSSYTTSDFDFDEDDIWN